MIKLPRLFSEKVFEAWNLYKECKLSPLDWLKIRKMPRYKKGFVSLWGEKWEYVDGNTLLAGLKEIFLDKCFQFTTDNDSPLIIDCGSNIGFSVLYFKKLYPKARVIAFEADPQICEVLSRNVNKVGLKGVTIINKAVWDSDETLEFRLEGGMSGRVRINEEPGDLFQIKGARLKNYLDNKVDFLKIDIEGAEYRVIKDCKDMLKNVKLLFLEYHAPQSEDQTLSEILEFLKSAGFRNYIKEAYVPINPFLEISTLDGMDLQLNIYSVRDVKNNFL